jgi:ERCC4-type nuclease
MLTLIVDTREQRPLEFKNYSHSFSTVRDTLYAADYGCRWEDGTEMPIAFERKSCADLFGTLTKGMERFKRELARAKEGGLQLILIIEGTVCDVLAGIPHSQVKGESILKTVFTLWVKYDLIPIFCPNRSEMEMFITSTFSAVARNYGSKKNEEKFNVEKA